MKISWRQEWKYFGSAWLTCVLLPLPALIFGQFIEVRAPALSLFFIGCVYFVAHGFYRDINPSTRGETNCPEEVWQTRIITTSTGLFFAFLIFAILNLALTSPPDVLALVMAFCILIPSICVVPYLMVTFKKRTAAVVFSTWLIACMKMAGGAVVALVYGWDACERGYTVMPWTEPNLLVWLFWFNTLILCVTLNHFGKKKFIRDFASLAIVSHTEPLGTSNIQ